MLHERKQRSESILIGLLAAACLISYAYFYQGEGWSMTSHFATIRSIVERRTFEISPFKDQTGDISVVEGRVYSNKPPGLALTGAVPYGLISSVERAAGADLSSHRVATANQYILTLLLSGVPGVALVVMLYFWFRTRAGVGVHSSLVLAAAFAFGSLVWPYSGMLFNHLFVAALVFGAWMLLTSEHQSSGRTSIAGLLLGMAALSEYLIGPLVLLFLAYELVRRRNLVSAALLCIGPAIAIAGLLVYHRINFGHALTPSYAYDNPQFIQPDLPLGRFHSPVWSRLYWLTWHRYRGLFMNCPVLILPLLSLVAWARPSPSPCSRGEGRGEGSSSAEIVIPLLIIAFFTLFFLTYVSWAGGWGVGPRFFIPAMAFLYLFAARGFERFPIISALLIAVSVFNMLTVTSVKALFEGFDQGPALHYDPLGVCLLDFVHGELAKGPGSFNLGMLMGLRGLPSLLPLLGVWIIIGVLIWRVKV